MTLTRSAAPERSVDWQPQSWCVSRVPSSSLYCRYDTVAMPRLCCPPRPTKTRGVRQLGGGRGCRRKTARDELAYCKGVGGRRVALGVPDERTDDAPHEASARTNAAATQQVNAFHFVLRSFKRPWHRPPCTPRAFRRDAPASRTPAAAQPRRQKPGAPRSPPWNSCTSRTQALARQKHAQSHAPLGRHGRGCVGVHKQVERACGQTESKITQSSTLKEWAHKARPTVVEK